MNGDQFGFKPLAKRTSPVCTGDTTDLIQKRPKLLGFQIWWSRDLESYLRKQCIEFWFFSANQRLEGLMWHKEESKIAGRQLKIQAKRVLFQKQKIDGDLKKKQ